MIGKRLFIPALVLATLGCEPDQPARATRSEDSTKVTAPSAAVADSGRGFLIGNRRFTMVIEIQRHLNEEHVTRVAFVDAEGRVHYELRHDSAAVERHGLDHSFSYWGDVVRGEAGDALFLFEEVLPSAPSSGVALYVLALVDGQLTQLSRPLGVYGSFPDQKDALAPGDIFYVDVWQGHYTVRVPIGVDLANCRPTQRQCVRAVPLDRYTVAAEGRPIEEAADVELFDAPNGNSLGLMRVTTQSKVQLIEGAARIVMERSGEYDSVTLTDDWLHVRVDDRAGWVRGYENLSALGLPAVG